MTIQTAVQLPDEAYERLKSLADASGQSPTDFMSKALLEYLEDVEDIARAEEIMSKIEAGERKTYTLEEVERRLGLDG